MIRPFDAATRVARPAERHSTRTTLLATATLALVPFAVVLAVSSPAALTVAVAAAVVLAGLRRALRWHARRPSPRRVCIPATDVCIDA